MNKFLFFILAFFVISCASHEPITDKKVQLANALVSVQFSIEGLDRVIEQYSLVMAMDYVKNYPEFFEVETTTQGKFDLAKMASKDILKRKLKTDFLKELLINYYAESVSSKDLQRFVDFFNTPMGKKASSFMEKSLEDINVVSKKKHSITGKEYLEVSVRPSDAEREFWRMMMRRLSYKDKTTLKLHSKKFKRFVQTFQRAISSELADINAKRELEISILSVISERGDEAYKSTIYQGLIRDKKLESNREKKGIGLNFGYEKSFQP